MPATGARQISYFPLAEGTRSSCATEDGEVPQAGLSFLRELISLSYPLQQTLPRQMRQVRPRGAWSVAEMQDKVPGMHSPVLSNQLERQVFVRFHFCKHPSPKVAAASGLEGV